MKTTDNIFSREKKLFHSTYNRTPVEISRGEGAHLISKDGIRYLDFFAGLAVNALGYANPAVNNAIIKQLSRFSHLSNKYITDVQLLFAEKLIKYSGMEKIFLTNSGTEAVEGVLKLLRKHYGPDKSILTLSNSFHGRTYGALSLTARSNYRESFKPLLPGIKIIKFNDCEDLTKNINNNTAAVFLEIVQGESGINVVSDKFISTISELRRKYEFAIVADEIQTGIGRTGKGFAYEHFNLKPDIVIAAKAIGGGLPLGAFLTNQVYSNIFNPGEHGTTFGGNPVACAAGSVVLTEVFENGLMEKVELNGKYFFNELEELKKKFSGLINDIRGIGFIIGVEFDFDANLFLQKMLERKVLVNVTNKNVLRILPPLIVGKAEIDFFLYNLYEVLKEFSDKK